MSIVESLKAKATFISSAISLVAAIGGAVIYVENNYAHAGDVKEILNNQQRQLRMYENTQRNIGVFQMEYYDDKLKQLNQELRFAHQGRAVRSLSEIQNEINDVKARREIARKSLLEPAN